MVWLYRLYPSLLDAIIIVQPETVISLLSSRLFAPTGAGSLATSAAVPGLMPGFGADPGMNRENPAMGRTADSRRIVDARDRSR
jgi:hypothetical protein